MTPLFLGCSEDFVNLATLIMQENHKTIPESVIEVINLYELLSQEIENI